MKLHLVVGVLALAGIHGAGWAGSCGPDSVYPEAPGSLTFTAWGFALPPNVAAPGGFNSGGGRDGGCLGSLGNEPRPNNSGASWLEWNLAYPAGSETRGVRILRSEPIGSPPPSPQRPESDGVTFWRVDLADLPENSASAYLSVALLPFSNQIRVARWVDGTKTTSLLNYTYISPGVPCAELRMVGEMRNGNAEWTVELTCPPTSLPNPPSPQRVTFTFGNLQHHTIRFGTLNLRAPNGEYDFEVFDPAATQN